MRLSGFHLLLYCCCLLWAGLNVRDLLCAERQHAAELERRVVQLEQRARVAQTQSALWAAASAANRSRGHDVKQLTLSVEWRSLATVVAFPPSQAQLVVANLHSWSLPRFAPCERYAHNASRTELVFYMSRRDDAAVAAVQDAMRRRHFPRHCFGRVSWRFANLTAAQDVYGAGTLAMWYGLWSAPLLDGAVDYFLWMEPDLRPVRERWLEHLVKLVSTRLTPVWQLGSLPRYKENNDWHLNGNAVYRANDLLFARFVLASRGAFADYLSFDKNLYEARRKDYAFSQRHDFMFQTTAAIQNRANEPFTLGQFLRQNADTFLVHGKGCVAALDKSMPKWLAELNDVEL
jgi:hypothetical protein